MSTTTTRIIGSGGDYSTISAWEAAAPADLTTSIAGGEIWRGECKAQAFDEDVTLAGSTTDATGYKHLTHQDGAGALGRRGVGARIVRTGTRTAGTSIITLGEPFAVVDGIAMTFTGTAAASGICQAFRVSASNCKTVRCLAYSMTLALTTNAFEVDPSIDAIIIANNIAQQITGSTAGRGFFIKTGFAAGPRLYTVTGNTAWNCSHTGLHLEIGTADTFLIRNNIGMGNGTADFGWSGTGQDSDFNLSSDATADDRDPGGGSSLITQVAADQFYSLMTVSSKPTLLLLIKPGSAAIGAGEDLGTNPWVATDILGRDRDAEGDTWDIGAHQRVAPVVDVKTVKASGGDYTTISAAIAAIPGDLLHAGIIRKIEIDAGTYDEDVILVDGTVLADLEHYVWVTTAAGSEHYGMVGAGVVIDPSFAITAGDDMTHWGAPYTLVEWLEITYSGTPDTSGGSSSGAKTNSHHVTYRWLMSHDINHAANMTGMSANACGDCHIENCLAWNIDGGNATFGEITGMKLDPGGEVGYPSRIRNCAVWDIGNASGSAASGWGYRLLGGGGIVAENLIAMDCKDLDFQFAGTAANIVSRNCLSSDATADDNHSNDGNGATHVINQTAADVFVSLSGSIDLHLKAASPAIGVGEDLGAGQHAIDIDGFDRDAAAVTWDIGADQFQAAAGGSPGTGLVVIAGFAPTVTGGGAGPGLATPGTGAVAIVGFRPTVGAGSATAFLVLNGIAQLVLEPEFEEEDPHLIGDESRSASGSLRAAVSNEKRRFRCTLFDMSEPDFAALKAMAALGAPVTMTGACVAGALLNARMTVRGSYVVDPSDPADFLIRPRVELVEM